MPEPALSPKSLSSELEPGVRVVGVDLSPAMLARAREAIAQTGFRNVEMLEMDAEKLEFPEATFDCVLCGFAVSSLPDTRRAVEEFHRVLRPGGVVGICDAFGWYFQHDPRWRWQEDVFLAFGVPVRPSGASHDLADVAETLQQSGFTDVRGVEESCDLIFSGPDQWWSWMWSHGTRSLLEAAGPDRLEALKANLFERLDGCIEKDGHLHGSLTAILVRGLRGEGAESA